MAFHKYVRFLVIAFACLVARSGFAQESLPQIGAQVWIEPGNTPAQIDGWFATLEQAHMDVARIFLMWPYLETSPGHWDFTLYDNAFAAASRHHVRIVATLTPSGRPRFRGGDDSQGLGLPDLSSGNVALTEYLQQVTTRFRSKPSLDSWLLLNEPGQGQSASPEAVDSFRRWLSTRYQAVDDLNRAWGSNFASFQTVAPPARTDSWGFARQADWIDFWASFQTGQLALLAERARQLDGTHPLHLNPHALVSNLAQVSDDLPQWRTFLDSLGCSIHPSWHFGLLQPDSYELGVSYVNDLVRGAIEPKPYWVTELQGGNNIYSGSQPMEPTAPQISEWVWTSVASGAKRVIFWLLNARMQGAEAGEWSLLTFAQQPSTRMLAAAKIADIVRQNGDFFGVAKPLLPPITILLSRETMVFEAADIAAKGSTMIDGRSPNAHVLEAFGFYRASASLGAPAQMKFIDDFDWDKTDQLVIVPDARVLTMEQVKHLAAFADRGNRVVVTGLSGFYNLHGKALAYDEFFLADLVHARPRELHTVSGEGHSGHIFLDATELPLHFVKSSVDVGDASPVYVEGGEVFASRVKRLHGGSVLWVPSGIGIAAKDGAIPLAHFLQREMQGLRNGAPQLASIEEGCLVRAMQSSTRVLTVISNGTAHQRTCVLGRISGHPSVVLQGHAPRASVKGWAFALGPHEAAVTLWKYEAKAL